MPGFTLVPQNEVYLHVTLYHLTAHSLEMYLTAVCPSLFLLSVSRLYGFVMCCSRSRVMSHRAVTVLVTDGDLRSVQAALWHGKPAVVLPTSVDQVMTISCHLSHRSRSVIGVSGESLPIVFLYDHLLQLRCSYFAS